MADVQIKNGYIRVANALADALAIYPWRGRELSVVQAVLRWSYGAGGRKAVALSRRELSIITGMQVKKLVPILARLKEKGVLFLVSEARFDGTPRTWGINKDYESWADWPTDAWGDFHALKKKLFRTLLNEGGDPQRGALWSQDPPPERGVGRRKKGLKKGLKK